MIGWKLRLWFKLILRRFKAIPLFCKVCGIRVRDFEVMDILWREVIGDPGTTRCWNCFCDACGAVGLEEVWELMKRSDDQRIKIWER